MVTPVIDHENDENSYGHNSPFEVREDHVHDTGKRVASSNDWRETGGRMESDVRGTERDKKVDDDKEEDLVRNDHDEYEKYNEEKQVEDE